MAINFPVSPTDGQTYTVNEITYVYNSSIGAWIIRADAVSLASINVTSGIILAGTMNVVPTIDAAYLQANTARDHANAAFLKANTAVTDFSPAYNQANLAFAQANTVFGSTNLSYAQANTARDHANAAFARANTGVNTFISLVDAPSSYSGYGGALVTVNPGGTGLQFTTEFTLDELVLTARVAPTTVNVDTMTVYVTATGTTPNREIAAKIKNEVGEEVILSSVLV